jgi:hypothetical protein
MSRRTVIAALSLIGMLGIGHAPIASAATPAPHATAAGGSHQLTALEGCLNQWVFDGVWRVRATKVSAVTSQFGAYPGYSIALEIRNGAKSDAMMMQTGVSAPVLALDDGNILTLTTEDAVEWNNKIFQNLPPSAGFSITLPYYLTTKPATTPKPQKLILEIDASKAWKGQPHFQVANPSLRIKLDCDAAVH